MPMFKPVDLPKAYPKDEPIPKPAQWYRAHFHAADGQGVQFVLTPGCDCVNCRYHTTAPYEVSKFHIVVGPLLGHAELVEQKALEYIKLIRDICEPWGGQNPFEFIRPVPVKADGSPL